MIKEINFNFDEEEIKMVKAAKEILQSIKTPSSSDLVIDTSTNKIGILADDNVIMPLNARFKVDTHCWLPHVHQLQRFLFDLHLLDPLEVVEVNIMYRTEFQFWLELFFERAFDLRWNGSEWIKAN